MVFGCDKKVTLRWDSGEKFIVETEKYAWLKEKRCLFNPLFQYVILHHLTEHSFHS